MAKQLKFLKPVMFPPRESDDSNFRTNLYGAKQLQDYRLKLAGILSCIFSTTAHMSCLFPMIPTK